MTKLGEMLKQDEAEALEAMKPALPVRRLKEDVDPMAVAVEHLMALVGVCLVHDRGLPEDIRVQLKKTVAAAGRAGLTNSFRRPR